MKKLYKFGFWILLLVIASLFNLWRISITSCENRQRNLEELNNKRILSILNTNTILDRRLDPIRGKNIVTDEISEIQFRDKTIAILLSDFECNLCQEKELKRLYKLKENIKRRGIKIIGITTRDKKNITARQIKITKIEFPIYWVDDNYFFEQLSSSSSYPQVIYIVNSIVVSAFIPIPKDDRFSEMFYSDLLKKLEYIN
ncbi:MAG: redoxin domain-containing protein [Ignavibacteriae bacterium]|nr:hypothetical protein [Ignavibacteriota bacterium]NOG97517.1 redoxin domain-containing protein [Ignavibacteriota bacterium]